MCYLKNKLLSLPALRSNPEQAGLLRFARPDTSINTQQTGFTLLEILIALFIFTILSMILVAALHGVITTQTETEEKATRLRSLQMALLILSRDVEQAVDRPILNDKGKPEPSVVGDASNFTLTHTGYANPTLNFTHSSLERVRYFIEDKTLIRQTWDVLDQAPKSVAHKRKLLENIDDISFEYLDNDGKLQAQWPSDRQVQTPQALPRAIKMTMIFNNWGKMSQLYVIPAEPSTAQQKQPPQT